MIKPKHYKTTALPYDYGNMAIVGIDVTMGGARYRDYKIVDLKADIGKIKKLLLAKFWRQMGS